MDIARKGYGQGYEFIQCVNECLCNNAFMGSAAYKTGDALNQCARQRQFKTLAMPELRSLSGPCQLAAIPKKGISGDKF